VRCILFKEAAMSFDEVKRIMKEAGAGFMATTDGEHAAVRPMGGGTWFGRELWFATGANSAKVAEIKKKPSVEFCFMDKEMRHVRISGKCTVSTDNGDKKKIYDAIPQLKRYYKTPADPGLVVLRTKVDRIRLMNTTDMKYTEVSLP
jgi:general stress protein 26